MRTAKIPFPDKLLWPNGSEGTRWSRQRAKTRAKQWASYAAIEGGMHQFYPSTMPIPVTITVYPKKSGPLPDRDNCVAACKHSLDAIAAVIGVNDRNFATPVVVFGPREDRFEITIG